MPLTKIVQELGAKKDLIQVPYDNQKANNLEAITNAVETLDQYLHAQSEPVTLVGISMGSQVICKWLRDKGPTTDLDPSKIKCVLRANPENRFTGVVYFDPKTFGGGYGGAGVPEDTPFKVIDFIRQYDGVADYPNVPKPNWVAVAHAVYGMARVHNFYFWVGLDDKKNKSYTVGNVTYTWSPSPVSLLFGGDLMRSYIETSYNRPVGNLK